MGVVVLDTSKTIFASQTLTDSGSPHDSADVEMGAGYKGVRLFLDVTAASGTSETWDGQIQVKDPVTGNYQDVNDASFFQQTGVNQTDLTVYPGIAQSANRTINDIIGRTFRLRVTIAGTTPSFTFSVIAEFLK